MWDWIEISCGRLGEEDRDLLEEACEFPGFDANNESAHFHTATVLIDKLDWWRRFKGRDINSHWPKLSKHREMLERMPSRSEMSNKGLSSDQLRHVLGKM